MVGNKENSSEVISLFVSYSIFANANFNLNNMVKMNLRATVYYHQKNVLIMMETKIDTLVVWDISSTFYFFKHLQ